MNLIIQRFLTYIVVRYRVGVPNHRDASSVANAKRILAASNAIQNELDNQRSIALRTRLLTCHHHDTPTS